MYIFNRRSALDFPFSVPSIPKRTSTTTITTTHEELPSDGPACSKRRRNSHGDQNEVSRHKSRVVDARPLRIRQNNPAAPSAVSQFLVLRPLFLLSRVHLPLIYLDAGTLQWSRLFAAHVQILEACHEDGDDDPSVLVVEEEEKGGERRLHVVERLGRRKYALCRLRAGVCKEELLKRARYASGTEPPRKRTRVESCGEDEKPWWAAARVEYDMAVGTATCPDAPKLCMDPKDSALSTSLSTGAADNVDDAAQPKDTPAESVTFRPTSEMLEELVKLYLDTLYLSRTPVAYFVKGPLARVRTAFCTKEAELVMFLRGAVLSLSAADKKYRECFPDRIKDLPVSEQPEAQARARRKRKPKVTRDRSGFFAEENDFLEQWWRQDNDPHHASDATENKDAMIKRRTQRIRCRETFLQIVLILEVMALEAAAPQLLAVTAESQKQESPVCTGEEASVERKSRKKKDVDITAVLDTLLDRLCIWYSLDEGSPVKSGDGYVGDVGHDELKSFASDVIIPFWGHRIPDQASRASKRLGGPSARNNKGSASSAPRKPGQPAARPVPDKKQRKPLTRVSTDTLNHAGRRPPLLNRSATDSDALAPLIKREQSEPLALHKIPSARTGRSFQACSAKRPSLLEQVSLGRREIDLSALSQSHAAKLRQKADVQQRLRDAIDTLKKPNRDRAVEELAKSADESFATAIARDRPVAAKKGPEAPAGAVAIAATPRRIKATPGPRRQADRISGSHRLGEEERAIVPGSSAAAIPQTGHRQRHIDETPSRATLDTSLPPPFLANSPSFRRSAAPPVPQTPAPKMPALKGMAGRTYTPRKETRTSREESNVYDELGWNEDDEYEVLA